jgi:hypothetical protein
MRIEKLLSDVRLLSLSPGERADVNTNSTENVEEPVFQREQRFLRN